MYCEFYQLKERPFNVTPDPKFLYLNARYREAIAALQYGITQRKGFITLIGEAGTGKTTLLKHLLDDLDPSTRTVFLFNTNVTFEEILEYIFAEFDLPVHSGKKLYMLQRLNSFLLDELANGRNVALLIDEAQDLAIPVLEDLRLLSNLETAKEKILQIVLSGQPELGQKLSNPALRQLRQRIGINCRLLPLSRDEVSEYIQFRLQAAGAADLKLFTRDAEDQIYHFSRGIPRLVNVVCDNALVIGYALGKRRIGADIIREAAADLLPLESDASSSARPEASLEAALVAEERASVKKTPEKRRRRLLWLAGGVFVLGSAAWLAEPYWTGTRPNSLTAPSVPEPLEVIQPGSLPDQAQDAPSISRGENQVAKVREETDRPRLAMLEDDFGPSTDTPMAGAASVREEPAGGLSDSALSGPLPQVAESGRGAVLEAGQLGQPVEAARAEVRDAQAFDAPSPRKTSEAEELEGRELDSRSVSSNAPAMAESVPHVARGGVVPESSLEVGRRSGEVADGEHWGGEQFTRFVIREGDSLSAIARAKYGQWSYTILDLIKLANPEIADVDRISPGQTLRLPDLREGLPLVRSGSGYSLLVFSTPNTQRAQQLSGALRQRGFDARVSNARLGTNKSVVRVTVFAGRTPEEAARVGQDLRKVLREDARIVRLGQ